MGFEDHSTLILPILFLSHQVSVFVLLNSVTTPVIWTTLLRQTRKYIKQLKYLCWECWKLYCSVGTLDEFMVFRQSFVTKESVNFVACVELCSYAVCCSFCVIFYAMLYDLLTMWTIISSQKAIHLLSIQWL